MTLCEIDPSFLSFYFLYYAVDQDMFFGQLHCIDLFSVNCSKSFSILVPVEV